MSDEQIHGDFEKDALLTILTETENLTNVGGWEWDTVKDKWLFSDNWLRIHGCAKRRLSTSELLQIAHPDDRADVQNAFDSAIAHGTNYEIEHRIVRQDTGEVRCVRAHGRSIRNSEGQVVKMYGAAQDITEFRQTEKKLRQSENQIENLVNNLPGVAYQCLMDKEGVFRFEYMGDNCVKLFGIKADAILSDADLVFDLIPEPDCGEVQKKIRESADTLTPYDIEHRVIKKNGETVWVHAVSTPWENDNGDIVWDGIGLDITKRRQAEKALEKKNRFLKRITENMFDMVSMTDLEGNYTFAGKSHERILGYATSELIGQNVMDYVHPDDLPRITQEFQTFLETGGTKTVQYRNRHRLGHYLWFETIGELLLDNNLNPSEIIFSSRDITERKEAEEKIAYLQKTESLGRMAGAVAHHFNNLLSVVMGNLELVLEDLPNDAKNRDKIFQAFNAAHKAADKSNQMLRYLGHVTGHQTTIDLTDICRQTLGLLQTTLPNGVTLKVDFNDSKTMVNADAGQIQQVLNSFFTNAWESISNNQGRIDLRIRTVSHEDISGSSRFPLDWQFRDIPYACLEISDTGCGISDENMRQIFDPFYTTKFTGRGMGLSVSIGIVKNLGGCITVDSKPGCGSVFRVYLPVAIQNP